MSNSPHTITYTNHAMSELKVTGEPVPGSESKGGVAPSFDTLMEELAGKIQGDKQTVRQFAAQVEAAVINIHQSHPDQMSESCMSQVKRTQLFHGLKRTYKETFRHLYEEEKASCEIILQAASTMEEALNHLMKIPREEPQTPHRRRSKVNSPHRRIPSWGWTRTGLEPEVVVHVNNQPLDAILDLGSNISLIDQEITDDIGVELNPFTCDVPQCVSIEGVKVTNSKIKIIGWVEIELGVVGKRCLVTRLWVGSSLFNKGVPIVLGGYQIKQILEQANLKRIDCWQQPWKIIHEWYLHKSDEELPSSEESFETPSLHLSQSPDRLLAELKVSTPTWEEQMSKVDELVRRSESTPLTKGIPGPLEEPDGQEDSVPWGPAQVGTKGVYPLPRIAWGIPQVKMVMN